MKKIVLPITLAFILLFVNRMQDYELIQVTQGEFVEKGTKWLKDKISQSLAEKGRAVVGFSGGSTPGPIYEELGKDTSIDWAKVHIFLIDERYVDKNNKDSNQYLIRNTLLKNANIPSENMIFPNADLSISECVVDYANRLRKLFQEIGYPDISILGNSFLEEFSS
jgi:6-phosphogluconolactonase